MQTYWNSTVRTHHDGRAGVSTVSSATTLPEALAMAVQDASYYRLSCGYEVTIELREHCARCENTGTVRKGKRIIRCPECKGKVPTGHVAPFPFEIHPNTVADLALAVA